ncbi:MAG TPA: F0F1 ATP synthase subunit alpha, partial [Firmicutes bacterium]|nr:F0F1 ATP synthase subunit alpha [Bacillota bacterium]
MKIDSNAIASLLKSQIENFDSKIEQSETGTVIAVGDGIATIYGLNNVMLGELLLFPYGVYGMAMNLDEEDVGAVLFGSDVEIKEGDNVKRTGKVVEVGVGDEV